MGQFVVENAHLSTDRKKYGDNYDHVFNRDKCQCEECLTVNHMATKCVFCFSKKSECACKKPNPKTPDSLEQSP
jgi:hypothetical protein